MNSTAASLLALGAALLLALGAASQVDLASPVAAEGRSQKSCLGEPQMLQPETQGKEGEHAAAGSARPAVSFPKTSSFLTPQNQGLFCRLQREAAGKD